MFGMGMSMLRIKGLKVGSIWISTIKAVQLTPIKVNNNKKCHKSHRKKRQTTVIQVVCTFIFVSVPVTKDKY